MAIAGVAGCTGEEEPEDTDEEEPEDTDEEEPEDTDEEEPEDTDEEEPTDGEVVAEVDPENISDHELFEQYQNPRATHVEGDEYAVAVEAMMYIYRPGSIDPIEVPENSVVTFYMTSRDITHAFTLENKNINAKIPSEEIVEVTVEFNESGEDTEYEITCGEEFCTDHESGAREDMVGKLQVLSSWEE